MSFAPLSYNEPAVFCRLIGLSLYFVCETSVALAFALVAS